MLSAAMLLYLMLINNVTVMPL